MLAIRQKDEEIAFYKDYKLKLSTKMLGETLDQHCQTAFEIIRATAFPYAYFGKDNDASGGSKGDYIYRDFDANGVEYISVMFEMKNEVDERRLMTACTRCFSSEIASASFFADRTSGALQSSR